MLACMRACPLSPRSWNKSSPSSSPCPHRPSPHSSGRLISPPHCPSPLRPGRLGRLPSSHPIMPLAPQARPATPRLPRATTPRTAMPPTTTVHRLHTWSQGVRYRWGRGVKSSPEVTGKRMHAPHMEPGAGGTGQGGGYMPPSKDPGGPVQVGQGGIILRWVLSYLRSGEKAANLKTVGPEALQRERHSHP